MHIEALARLLVQLLVLPLAAVGIATRDSYVHLQSRSDVEPKIMQTLHKPSLGQYVSDIATSKQR